MKKEHTQRLLEENKRDRPPKASSERTPPKAEIKGTGRDMSAYVPVVPVSWGEK